MRKMMEWMNTWFVLVMNILVGSRLLLKQGALQSVAIDMPFPVVVGDERKEKLEEERMKKRRKAKDHYKRLLKFQKETPKQERAGPDFSLQNS
ncbi:hypothetical protein [Bacillus sp. NPDC077027]|uniref:hypothetical protein n=1 Tax=Bacillus sp. NPDC077027 TaxID=3390548 RepID=UPI003D074338